MSLLIINTLKEKSPILQDALKHLTTKTDDYLIIDTTQMNINSCIGCNACWLITPGICSLKDDYEQILKAILQYDTTIFISDTALGFVSYRTKNIIDRMLPLATMYTHVENGQMRHIPRYEKKFQFGLLYSGICDVEYIDQWLERVALNFKGRSMGVYSIEQYKEVILCI